MECETFDQVQLKALVGDASKEARRAAAKHARSCKPCREAARRDRSLEGTFSAGERAALSGFDAARQALLGEFENRRATCCRVEAPFGPVFLARTARGLCRVSIRYRSARDFLRELEARELLADFDPDKLRREARELEDYFSGRRKTFQVPVDLRFVTPFQKKVLDAAKRIPFGCVRSYGEIAREIGKPEARRAVGGALGKNPVAIVIPCHRVVSADGSLGGYTGGLHIKRELMRIEGISMKEERK